MTLKALLLVFIICFAFCKLKDIETDKTDRFEGKVFYHVRYPEYQMDDSKFGSTIIIFYSNGYIKKEYRTSTGILLTYTIYNPKSNTTFSFTPNNDTVFYYHPIIQEITKNTSSGNTKDTIILDYSCEKISISAQDNNYVYYISNGLKVDKKYLSGASHNFLFDGFVILKYFLSKPGLKEVTATKISHEKIDSTVFRTDTINKIMIKME